MECLCRPHFTLSFLGFDSKPSIVPGHSETLQAKGGLYRFGLRRVFSCEGTISRSPRTLQRPVVLGSLLRGRAMSEPHFNMEDLVVGLPQRILRWLTLSPLQEASAYQAAA